MTLKLNSILILIFSILILSPLASQSEPWLSNRFANNCAGCHAPGRLNLPPKKRRCTLSCQGCHVNPNGGGMRSDYGKWTQQRWLKTFHIKGHKASKNAPAPDFAQGYMQKSKTMKYAKKTKRIKKKIVNVKKKGIAKMYSTSSLDHNPKYYDKESNLDWKKVNARSTKQFLSRVPIGDPWRTERDNLVSGGADLRYFLGALKNNNEPDPEKSSQNMNLLMGADIGIRFKPIREHLSFVVEGRFSGNPRAQSGLLEPLENGAVIKSAYAFSDNLPYNTWFMAGKYRPNFGHYTADHDALLAKMSGMGQYSSYNAIGFGGSPNVPFFDAHIIAGNGGGPPDIMSTGGPNIIFDDETGFNINVGARAITFGLSGKFSYWATSKEDGSARQLISVSGGAKYKRLTGNFDFLRWSVVNPEEQETAGNVSTVDLKYRAWRENYLSLNFASANTSLGAFPGRTQEYTLGIRSYLLSGLKLDMMFKNRISETTNETLPDSDTTIYYLQLHSYF